MFLFFIFFLVEASFDDRYEVLIKSPLYRLVNLGVRVESLHDVGDSDLVFASNDTQLFVPASITKILLTAAVLNHFSPFYRFKTPIRTDGVLYDDVLNGDLFLVGRGDPSMDELNLIEAVSELKSMGIRKIEGDICYDISFFDEDLISLKGSARHFNTVSGPLNCRYNTIDLRMRMGKNPKIWLDPKTSYAYLKSSRLKFFPLTDKAFRPELFYQQFEWGDQFSITGIVSWADYYNDYLKLLVTRPGLFTATLFKELCEKNGISILGKVRPGRSGHDAIVLVTLKSLTIGTILKVLNRDSNNMVASVLNKDLGAYYHSLPGSRAKGLSVIRSFCQASLSFELSDYQLKDASGLSLENQFSCWQFSQLLKYSYFHSTQEIFLNTLIKDFEHQFQDDLKVPSFLRIRFKTGTLSHSKINTLVGYIFDDRTDKVYSFVVMADGRRRKKYAYKGLYTQPVLSLIIDHIVQEKGPF